MEIIIIILISITIIDTNNNSNNNIKHRIVIIIRLQYIEYLFTSQMHLVNLYILVDQLTLIAARITITLLFVVVLMFLAMLITDKLFFKHRSKIISWLDRIIVTGHKEDSILFLENDPNKKKIISKREIFLWDYINLLN